MKTFVFVLSADRVLLVKAGNVRDAMDIVEERWNKGAFGDSFQVFMVTGIDDSI